MSAEIPWPRKFCLRVTCRVVDTLRVDTFAAMCNSFSHMRINRKYKWKWSKSVDPSTRSYVVLHSEWLQDKRFVRWDRFADSADVNDNERRFIVGLSSFAETAYFQK